MFNYIEIKNNIGKDLFQTVRNCQVFTEWYHVVSKTKEE